MKIGITFSAFDLLHSGHILMLEEAKNHCDYLIACLQTDPSIDREEKNSPVQTMYERWVQLNAVRVVDKIIPYTTEKEVGEILLSQPVDIRFVGEEYKDKDFTGKDLCLDNGIEIYYNSRRHSFSSTKLRGRVMTHGLHANG